MSIPLETKQKIKELHNQGLSSRKICVELGWSKSRKSTVNDILKQMNTESKHSHLPKVLVLDDLDELCDNPDWNVSKIAKQLRYYQKENNRLRKLQRDILDQEDDLILKAIKDLPNNLRVGKYKSIKTSKSSNKTLEVLFSDLQIGKKSQFYNTENAIKAVKYYGEELLAIVNEVRPEQIIIAFLGDNIECARKHGQQSAYSTDTSNAQQIINVTNIVWNYVLKPLIDTGISIKAVGLAGNHGSDSQKGFDMYKAGLYTYDYVIYKSLEQLCDVYGGNVEWDIPEGCFTWYSIYGHNYLAEHGYFNTSTEKSMNDHKTKRMENLKTYLHGYRCGDMHHVVQYDCSNLVVNGAFFGVEMEGGEYSGILGFNSIPAQVVMIHEPSSKLGTSTVVGTRVIQVGKGYL